MIDSIKTIAQIINQIVHSIFAHSAKGEQIRESFLFSVGTTIFPLWHPLQLYNLI
jgi:hypothetical protein